MNKASLVRHATPGSVMFVGESRAQTVPERSKDILGQPTQDDLEVYEALPKLPLPKSHAGKMLLVAFRS